MYNYKLQHRHIAKLPGDIGEWDNKHNIPRDDLARAVYIKWREGKTGATLLSADYRKLLADNGL